MKRLSLILLVFTVRLTGFSQAAPGASLTSTMPKVDDPAVWAAPAFTSSPAPTTAASVRPRETSADTTAKINSTLPKFTPPSTTDAKKSEEQPDLREIDKPRNGIIRLPKYIVQEPKIPAFKERELLTLQGKLNLAYKRHPGLRFGSLPFLSNNGIALFMLAEEEQLERKAEREELYGLYKYSDPKAGAAVKRETNPTFIRHDGP